MLYHSLNLLESTELSAIVNKLMSSPDWIDGAVSASGGAKLLKRNIQLSPLSDTYKGLEKGFLNCFWMTAFFCQLHISKKIINILFLERRLECIMVIIWIQLIHHKGEGIIHLPFS